MKKRSGFVSNSSACSFIIRLEHMTEEQKQMMYNHIEIAQEIDKKIIESGKPPRYEYYENWFIGEDDFAMFCATNMDNFDLCEFMEREVGLNKDVRELMDDCYFFDIDDIINDNKYLMFKRGVKLKKITDGKN